MWDDIVLFEGELRLVANVYGYFLKKKWVRLVFFFFDADYFKVFIEFVTILL